MYSKFVAILINSAFGLCITYTVFSVYFALTSKFIVERSFILGFSLYNIVWLVLDIVYNEARYHRQGGGLFYIHHVTSDINNVNIDVGNSDVFLI